MADSSNAPIYNILDDFGGSKDEISFSPYWAFAIIPLGRPVTYNRYEQKGIGPIVQGAYSRKVIPTIITDDCTQCSVSNSKNPQNPTKNLSMTLKPASGYNYLDQSVVLPGDWILAWAWNNKKDADRVLDLIYKGQAANGVKDGLKFVGRVHSARKHIQMSGPAHKIVTYSLQAVSFVELDTAFFYDTALANTADVEKRLGDILARIGLDFTEFAAEEQTNSGNLKDNTAYLVTHMIDLVLGSSAQGTDVNNVSKNLIAVNKKESEKSGTILPDNIDNLIPSPQVNSEAPYSYLVPKTVGLLLGFPSEKASKAQDVFGYADILQTLIGVQKYAPNDPDNPDVSIDFFPILGNSGGSRWFTNLDLKGTFLPVESAFVNRPLWQMIQQYNNSAINEMFTSLKATPAGILPTLIVRQIPFSTEVINPSDQFPLTKFMNLPRWVLAPSLIRSLDVGRDDTTHTNLVHVYGNSDNFENNQPLTAQMARNPPIFDDVDIARSGLRADMDSINCALYDQIEQPKYWMEAIADFKFGSQYTLNGSVQCLGIQSAVCEGDNLEIEDIVYHIEEVTHQWGISPDGKKYFITSMSLSNGMPKDQSGATQGYPRYPGFTNTSQPVPNSIITAIENNELNGVTTGDLTGDSEALTSMDPGITSESR